MRARFSLPIWPVLLLIAGACYHYVPATAGPEPGRVIRVALTDEGATAVTDRLGPDVLEIDGLLLGREGGELSLLIESYMTRRQGALFGGNEAMRLPVGYLASVEERRIDPVRSALFGAAIATGAFAAVRVLGPGGLVFDDDDDQEPGPVELIMRVPLRLGR